MSQRRQKIRHFHYTHGSDIIIHRHWNEARRTQNTTNGIVFTSKSIQINQKIAIKLLHVSDELPAIISIGFTVQDPKSLHHNMPTCTRSDLKRMTGFWMCPLPKQVCTKDRVLFFYVNSSGHIKYGMDGEEKGTFEKNVDIRGQLWGLIDIWSPSTAIQLCGYTLKSAIFHHFSSRNLKISDNCLHKTYKKRRTSYAFTQRPLQVNEMIKIKFSDEGSFALGLTSCDPANLKHRELTENLVSLIDRPEYWVVVNDPTWYFKHNEEISYVITKNGELKIWKNSSLLLKVIHVDQNQPLWGFFALCSVRSIEVTSCPYREISMATPSAPKLGQDQIPSCSSRSKQSQGATSSSKQEAPSARNLKTNEGDHQNDSLCVVCCENATEAALIPCGHMCMCFRCAERQWREGGDGLCPMCRARIQNVLKIYKS